MNKKLNQLNSKAFSSEEIELMKKECNKIMPISESTIDKITSLNELYPENWTEPNKWTEMEVDLLKEFYPIGGYELCKEKGLDRSKMEMQLKYMSV